MIIIIESRTPLTKLSKNDQLLAFNSIHPRLKFMFFSHMVFP